jgi:predicted Zn-dependent protease
MIAVRRTLSYLFAAALAAAPAPARAQGIPIARDAEIENNIRAFGTPIWDAAGLSPQDITIRIVADDDINSFVMGGQNIFVNSGLLLLAQNANQVIGVIAHETGHISGGHLSRMEEEQRNAMMESIIAMVLGAGAMATGAPGAGQAVIAGGTQVAQRQLLAYSRSHEASADTAALSFLDRTHQSSRGLMDFLILLEKREGGGVGHQDQYVLTHPLTPDRIEFVQHHVETSPWSDTPEPPEFNEMFARIQAKLIAFLHPPDDALTRYPAGDNGIAARYARAIAYYRKPDLAHALPLIDGLIAERPADPYFEELKGQMLFENGRVREAITPYETAVRLLPDNILLRIGLGQAYLETNDPAYLDTALANLTQAVQEDRRMPQAWRQLAVAYGRKGDIGLSALALAERAYLVHDDKEARTEVARAEKLLPENSAGWLRAEDIKKAIANRKK